MKTIIVAVLACLAFANALPQEEISAYEVSARNIVTDLVSSAIEDLSQQIRDAGLDPVNADLLEQTLELPVSEIFNAKLSASNVHFSGISDIVINSISYGYLTSRLRFDISLPRIVVSAKSAELEVNLFGYNFGAEVGGKLEIVQPRIAGDVRISLGIFSGIGIRSLDLNIGLRNIQSDLSLRVMREDYSNIANNLLNHIVPTTLRGFNTEINQLIEHYAWIIINDRL